MQETRAKCQKVGEITAMFYQKKGTSSFENALHFAKQL